MGASIFGGDGIYGGTRSAASSGPSGSGTLNYIAKWTPNGTTLGDSLFFDNGTNVLLSNAAGVAAHFLDVVKSQDDVTTVNINNSNVGTSSSSRFRLTNGTNTTTLQNFGTGYTTSNANFQNGGLLQATGAGGLSIVTSNASGDLRFYVGSSTAIAGIFLATNGFFGVNVSPTATGHFVGNSSTSGAYAFKAENSSLTNLMSIRNDGFITFGAGYTWDNSNKEFIINTTTSSNLLSVTNSGAGNCGLFTYTGGSGNQVALYARTTTAGSNLYAMRANREVAGDNTYFTAISLGNQAGTTIGVGAGAGLEFGASTSTLTTPVSYAQMGMITTSITNASYAGYLFWKTSTGAALVENMRLYAGGLILATTGSITSPNAASLFELVSTTQGLRFPNMTTTQRDAISSPPAGLVIYNTSTNKLNVYTTAWEAITSA